MITRPQGILFDLGDTLLNEEVFDVEAGTRRVLSFAHNPRGLSVRDVCDLVAELDSDLRDRREASWMEQSPFTVHRLVYEPHGVSFDRPFHEVEQEFWRAATRFSPTPGIQELLASLSTQQLRLGVVSNAAFTSQILAWQLNEFGLGRFFEFLMSSADYGVRKPHPALLCAAARKLGTHPETTWFVGDSPKYDVAGAANAGMVSVLYRPSPGPPVHPAPDMEVESWGEFSEQLIAAT